MTLPDSNQLIVAGVIRPINGIWQWVTGGHTHIPSGATVTQDKNVVMINYGTLSSAVVTFIVTTDETLAAGGYTCGASVNRDVAKISLFRRDGTRVSPSDHVPASGNLWIYGLFLL